MIQFKQFGFRYGRKQIFQDLSLDLKPGYIYGLLGKNGTGKSTLFKNIAGLLQPGSGQLKVMGFRPFDRHPDMLKDVFLLPEEFAVPAIKIQEMVKSLAPFYPNFDHDLFHQLLKEFEIPIEQSMNEMSLGQKKKSLISFSLATRTKILLLDEPTNGLDILSKTQFKTVIRNLTETQPRCIVISTHQVKDIEDLVNRITVLDQGSILFDAETHAISERLVFSSSPQAMLDALYQEPSARGFDHISRRLRADQTQGVDMELLYKWIMKDPVSVAAQFSNPMPSNA